MRVGMDHNVLDGDDMIERYSDRDLANHKKGKPYEIVKDETFGRHMVASRNISAGETVMEDFPLTLGPMVTTEVKAQCLGCYKALDSGCSARCEDCGWPVCSAECSARPEHRDGECQVFRDRNFTLGSSQPNYNCISPLRALRLRDTDPDRFNLIWGLMSHNEARRKEKYWVSKHQEIIKYIREVVGATEYSEEDIDTVLGIFLVNDFEINARIDEDEWSSAGNNESIRGLYQIASIPNHDCIANTVHQFSSLEDGFRMIVKAARDIKKGEEITHSYVDAQEPFLVRQELLRMGKFFNCSCPRCRDNTELGSYSSALLCPTCRTPVITRDVTDLSSDWACTKCSKLFPSLKISKVTGAIKEQAELLEYNKDQPEKCGVEAHETFLKKYQPILHPNHVVLVKVKYALAKMYGRMEGYEANNLNNSQLERKQLLCQEVLRVLDVIMPGQSRMRGVMMYELHLPLVLQANKQLQQGPGGGADPAKIKANLKLGLKYLKQGMAILKLQPEGSFESKIVAGSRDSVGELEKWVKTITEAL